VSKKKVRAEFALMTRLHSCGNEQISINPFRRWLQSVFYGMLLLGKGDINTNASTFIEAKLQV